MIKKIEGIILSEVDYKESSKIINVLTKEYGIIGFIAKGTKKVNSPLTAVTSKLTYGYFHVKYKENGLSTLMEVDVIDRFKNIKKDISMMSYSLYLLELSDRVYKHSENNTIYDELIASLKKINEGYDYQVITNIFELKMLDYLGIKPVVDECVNCGSKHDIVTISKKAAQINGSRLELRENMQISLKDLLYGLMLRSGNDAAIAKGIGS